ncbi:hypothetical protein C8J56DRAFT_1066035 [Mycena floridula]|nr:hypothetical protein C8J56DRAFT_1066035 [Mycena floridula]
MPYLRQVFRVPGRPDLPQPNTMCQEEKAHLEAQPVESLLEKASSPQSHFNDTEKTIFRGYQDWLEGRLRPKLIKILAYMGVDDVGLSVVQLIELLRASPIFKDANHYEELDADAKDLVWRLGRVREGIISELLRASSSNPDLDAANPSSSPRASQWQEIYDEDLDIFTSKSRCTADDWEIIDGDQEQTDVESPQNVMSDDTAVAEPGEHNFNQQGTTNNTFSQLNPIKQKGGASPRTKGSGLFPTKDTSSQVGMQRTERRRAQNHHKKFDKPWLKLLVNELGATVERRDIVGW